VVGYADIQTGSLAYNEKLALRRAEAVVQMLVTKFGVSPSLLKATVGNLQNPPFTDTIYNRTAIIRVP
jgi:outer membrane protein OmpA-like peptidoglycan-associated protein